MEMTEKQKDHLRAARVAELQQACLSVMKEAGELFDRFEEHGLEAAWEGDGALVVMRMEQAHEVLRSFLARQAVARMAALGFSTDSLAGLVTSPADFGEEDD